MAIISWNLSTTKRRKQIRERGRGRGRERERDTQRCKTKEDILAFDTGRICQRKRFCSFPLSKLCIRFQDHVWMMLHSGSRNIGNVRCRETVCWFCCLRLRFVFKEVYTITNLHHRSICTLGFCCSYLTSLDFSVRIPQLPAQIPQTFGSDSTEPQLGFRNLFAFYFFRVAMKPNSNGLQPNSNASGICATSDCFCTSFSCTNGWEFAWGDVMMPLMKNHPRSLESCF